MARFRIFFHIILLLFSLTVFHSAKAFQLYSWSGNTSQMRMSPENKKFNWYVSDAYFDFQHQQLMKTGTLQVAIIQHALDELVRDARISGLQFLYSGTFNAKAVSARLNKADDDTFQHKIYYDLTGTDWTGVVTSSSTGDYSEHAGNASPQFSKSGGTTYFSGGLEHFNSKLFDFIHPRGSMMTVLIHETLHILGLDHSTVAGSRMAYTNPVWGGLGEDDVLGLQQIYGGPYRSEFHIEATLEGTPAQGIEIVLIDTTTGRSFNVITAQKSGTATIKSVPPGRYLVSGRELTPTGPCFDEPTQGFLTSFYVNEGVATNDPNIATAVEITEGLPVTLKLALIKGTKRFDCYYSSAQWADWWDNNHGTIALFESATPGAHYLNMMETDLQHKEDIHVTNTSFDETANAGVTIRSMGTNSPIIINSSTYGKVFESSTELVHLNDVTISPNAAEGGYAALCYYDGEYALSSSFVNVRTDISTEKTTGDLFPNLKGLMSESTLPASSFEGSPSPVGGKKPLQIAGVACGSIASTPSAKKTAAALLLLPLVLIGIATTWRRGKNV